MTQTEYRREIDGLRALALLPVLFFHAGFSQFSGGFVGVDIFFVISGFLITSVILRERARGDLSFARFYERRARRILPALFLVLLVISLPAFMIMTPLQLKEFGQSLVATILSGSNFLFFRKAGYFDSSVELKPLLHTWSLAVEEQFYLVFPPLLLLAYRLGRRWIWTIGFSLALASFGFAQWASSHLPIFGFYLAPTRAWEILAGSLLALSEQERFEKKLSTWPEWLPNVASVLGFALIANSIFTFDSETPFPSFYTLLPVAGTLMIIRFADSDTFLGRCLATPGLVGIGLISYSAYLWHQPVYAFARLYSLRPPSKLFFSALIVLVLAIAALSWRWVETPFRKANSISFRALVISLSSIAMLILGLGVLFHTTDGFEADQGSQMKKITEAVRSVNPRQKECESGVNHDIDPSAACSFGSSRLSEADASVVLMGDSHADALFTSLDKVFVEKNVKGRMLSYAACPPAIDLFLPRAQINHHCREYNSKSLQFLTDHPKIKTVILAARWTIYAEGERFDNMEGGVEFGSPAPADRWTTSNEDLQQKISEKYYHNSRLLLQSKNEELQTSLEQRKQRVFAAYKATIEGILKLGKSVVLIYPLPEAGWNVPNYLAKLDRLGNHKISPEDASTSTRRYERRNGATIHALDQVGAHSNLWRVNPKRLFCDSLIAGRCVTHIDGDPLYYDDNHLSRRGAELIAAEVARLPIL